MAQTENGLNNQIALLPALEFPNTLGYRCFVDGFWKDTDQLSGIGWFFSKANKEEQLMGACNLRRSLSPLHAEDKALVWAMGCLVAARKTYVHFVTDCSNLLNMVSTPTQWPAFGNYLEEIMQSKVLFRSFSISLVSRKDNVKADLLGWSARVYTQDIMYLNNVCLSWLIVSFN